MVENGGSKYQKVAVRSLVMVRIPNHSDCMRQLDECQFVNNGKTVKIERRWMNGMPVGKIILNRNFYGILSNDLGKNIVARVEVIEKTVSDGRKFIMLDIHKMPKDKSPSHRLKISDEVGGFPILGTQKFIHFVPLNL